MLITARSELRKVLFLALSVAFCLCMKYLGNRWTDLRQIHTEDVFGPSLGRVWRSRSFGGLRAPGFMFGKKHFCSGFILSFLFPAISCQGRGT